MDDVTLGKLLTEAHRGLVDCCEPECVSVSQLSSSGSSERSRQPDGEMFDRSVQADEEQLESTHEDSS